MGEANKRKTPSKSKGKMDKKKEIHEGYGRRKERRGIKEKERRGRVKERGDERKRNKKRK